MGDGKKLDVAAFKAKMAKIRAALAGEMNKAMKRPTSAYGGPVRISSGVPLKFPYTFTAKIVQFPWKFYIVNNWMWKYYFIAVVVCMPIFKKISNLANSKENKEKWAKIRAQEAHGH